VTQTIWRWLEYGSGAAWGGRLETEECLKALTDFTLAKPCYTFTRTLYTIMKQIAGKSSCPAFSLPMLLVLTFLASPSPPNSYFLTQVSSPDIGKGTTTRQE